MRSSTVASRSESPGWASQKPADFLLIGQFVGLARGPCMAGPLLRLSMRNWMAVASIARPIEPAQGVDLAHQLPLGQAADGRIAAHPGDGVQAAGQQGGPGADAGGGRGRFRAGVTAADHQNVEIAGRAHWVHDMRGWEGRGGIGD